MRSSALLGLLLTASIILAGCTTDDEPTTDDSELAAPEDHEDHDGVGHDDEGAGAEHSDAMDGDDAMTTEGDANATAAPNTPPVAELAADLLEGTVPFDVNFTLAGADAEGDDLSWVFDADGDGTADSEGTSLPFNFTFSYVAAGNYTAILAVTDGTEVHNQTVTIVATEAVEEAVEEVADDGMCHRPDAIASPDGHYLDDRPGDGFPAGTGFVTGGGTWVYEESNGVEGLQVGGAGESAEYADCENPDTLIF